MNKRTSEIAEQAEIRFKKLYIPDTTYVHESPAEVTRERLQKFAELLIRECLDKVRECVQTRVTSRYYPDSDGRKIKEHFGVE